MKLNITTLRAVATYVAPPCGVRGLKFSLVWLFPRRTAGRTPLRGAWIEMSAISCSTRDIVVAPPCGVRGLKWVGTRQFALTRCRTPSRGAWIEIGIRRLCRIAARCRTPSWGAWIEIAHCMAIIHIIASRTPSRGAWIEISTARAVATYSAWIEMMILNCPIIAMPSHPLAGCVD